MLLHEKMRLQRKINKLTLKQLHMGNVQERMQKKIDRREKYYSKLEKQLERQANAYKNSMNMQISNQFGLGISTYDMSGMGFAGAGAVQIALQQLLNDPTKTAGLNKDLVKLMQSGNGYKASSAMAANESLGNGITLKEAAAAGDIIDLTNGKVYKAAEANGYQALERQAQVQVTQMQAQANQMKQCYEQQVSIWLEAQQEQLQAQKEWEMDLLEEEQADMEAEKTSVEAQLEMAKQRKEAIESELGNSIKDAAPKFGLG